MSYIRFGQEREWTEGPSLYVYSNGSKIVSQGGWGVPPHEWVEITMRMLDQSDSDFEEDELERICEALCDRIGIDPSDHQHHFEERALNMMLEQAERSMEELEDNDDDDDVTPPRVSDPERLPERFRNEDDE